MPRSLKILNVEDDDDDAAIVARALSSAPGRDYELFRTSSLGQVPQAIAAAHPDLILLDLHLPDARGADTVQGALRHAADIPILVLTGSGSEQIGRSSIEAGAQDFIPKAEMMSGHLTRSIDFAIHRKQMQRDAEMRAMRDPLTGLFNRAGLMHDLAAATARVRRQGGGFALAFLDLDGFKAINDRLGHAAGDEVLTNVAKRAQSIARVNDTLCRSGGDEFVFLLDGVNTRAKARQGASRFAAIIAKPMVLSEQFGFQHVTVSASFGLAVCPKDSVEAEELMTIADGAMYENKRARQAAALQSAAFRANGAARMTLSRN